jgi:predicted CopG family antitoxin
VAYKTVNLKPATYERLRMYQIGGKSLSDVLDELMDTVDPQRWHALELRIARKRLEEMRTKDIGVTLEELDRSLARDRRKADSATSRAQAQARPRGGRDRARIRSPRASARAEGT